MKKVYKISVDCANCANKIETAVNKIDGVNNATLNFMSQKLIVDFKENADVSVVLNEIKVRGKKIESDFVLEG